MVFLTTQMRLTSKPDAFGNTRYGIKPNFDASFLNSALSRTK